MFALNTPARDDGVRRPNRAFPACFCFSSRAFAALTLVGVLAGCQSPNPTAGMERQNFDSQYTFDQTATHRQIWLTTAERRQSADAAFILAQNTGERTWIKRAVNEYGKLTKKHPDDATIKAHFGAALALYARTPQRALSKGLANKWYGSWHGERAIKTLNEAIMMDPLNPRIRLLRGEAFAQLDETLNTDAVASSDMSMVEQWLANPLTNSDEFHSVTLTDRAFQEKAYLSLAQYYEETNRIGDARRAWASLRDIATDPTLQVLAHRRLDPTI